MTSYEDELAGLAGAYGAAIADPGGDSLDRAREVLRGRSAFAVASGGAFPAARLAAALHRARTGRSAQAMTPLAYAAAPPPIQPACLLLVSATSRHPDTAAAAAAAVARGHPVLLVSQRRADELAGPLAHPSVTVLTVPQPGGRDGFLATQSLLASAAVLVRLYRGDDALPATLPALGAAPPDEPLRERVLVLYGPDEHPAADDAEARLSEPGLAAVQVADYRNLAHGRHFGLWRHLERTTVVSLAGPASAALADRTLGLLPPGAATVRLSTPLEGAAGTLDLLVRTMRLPALAARQQGIALHRPGVAPFGRRLYHLATKPGRRASDAPPARKMAAAGLPPEHPSAGWYDTAYQDWARALKAQPIGAVVLDYDGTLVTTAGRYEPPSAEVRHGVIRLLDSGLPVGFASGRGDSLHSALRGWVPREHWPLISLGLHNGAWRLRLTGDPDEPEHEPDPALAEAQRRLAQHPPEVLTTRRTATQLTVTSPDTLAGTDTLRAVVEAAVRASPALDVLVASSGHSVDVTSSRVGKHLVVDDMHRQHGAVLAIGDRGDAGGNDFAMLAATPWSISVDRCSADPTRCWAPAAAGTSGPHALLAVLAALKPAGGSCRWAPGPPRRASRTASR